MQQTPRDALHFMSQSRHRQHPWSLPSWTPGPTFAIASPAVALPFTLQPHYRLVTLPIYYSPQGQMHESSMT
jgi:hypothetical protein